MHSPANFCVEMYTWNEQKCVGTRAVPFQQVLDVSTDTRHQYLMSVAAMPQYSTKSVEELRFEDHQVFLNAD